MSTTLDVFISSKMQELKPERDALFEFLKTLDYGDIQLHAWVFEEDAPASSRTIRDTYLRALQNSALYIGLMWNELGEWTLDELERATEWGVERHVYVKDVDAHQRSAQLRQVLDKYNPVDTGITTKWFTDIDGLKNAVKQSIETWIDDRLRARSAGPAATLVQGADDLAERPRNLVGRKAVLDEVRGLLTRGERVLLHGFGGIGKTALAAAVAGEWITSSGGSVLWLKAGSASPETLFQALARPFDAQQLVSQPHNRDAASEIRVIIRKSGATLVVLDDCWNGRALFAALKALPNDVAALITSRQRYAVDNIVDVRQLSEQDAVDLVVFHAKQDPSPQIAALCRVLAFHPFSLEIAGKTLKVQRWTADELLTRISDRPHELSVPGEFSEIGRASVKELLDATVRVLDQESREVFLAFGAFSTPQVTVQMLAQYRYSFVIWGDEELTLPAIANDDFGHDKVRAALQNLELQGLAVRLPVKTRSHHSFTFTTGQNDIGPLTEQTELVEHYRIHDLAYAYTRGRTGDDLRKKALDICLAYTFFHGSPGPLTYESVRSEIDNLLGAASFALDHGYYHHVERFATNLYVVSRFLDYEGAHLQAIRLLEQAVNAAAKRGDTEAQYRQLGNLGKSYLQSGDSERARQTTNDALALARREKDEQVEQLMLTNLGATYLAANEMQQAYEYLQQGLEITRRLGDRRGQGQLLGNLGLAHATVGLHDEAYGLYKEAVEIAVELGDDESAAIGLANLGRLFLTINEYEKAEQVSLNSIRLFRKTDRTRQVSGIVWGSSIELRVMSRSRLRHGQPPVICTAPLETRRWLRPA